MTIDILQRLKTALFQSTRPVWGVTDELKVIKQSIVFQSTRPVGGVTKGGKAVDAEQIFQSTRPVGGVTAKMTVFYPLFLL